MTADASPQRFAIHHIGARGSGRGFPVVPRAERDISVFLYDADVACIPTVESINRDAPTPVTVLPYCLSDVDGTASFYDTAEGFTSSILEPLPSGLWDNRGMADYDLSYDSAYRVRRVQEISCHRLDTVCAHHPEIDAPTFMILDTQGSELAILRGAGALLDNVVGVIIEVFFTPLYRDQPVFDDVQRFMSDNGFDLMEAPLGGSSVRTRLPLGARARGQAVHTDLLYLRRPDGVNNAALAYASLALGHASRTAECLPLPPQRSSWGRLVEEFQELLAARADPLPPEWAEVVTEEQWQAQFDPILANPRGHRAGQLARRFHVYRPTLALYSAWTRVKSWASAWHRWWRMGRLQAPYLRFAQRNDLSEYAAAIRAHRVGLRP
ncbi:MAG: FkbM family methyltransferase [Actinomycetales bacterium]|nr:FkbM family methyltransferase [Actinomycetales bacterium]